MLKKTCIPVTCCWLLWLTILSGFAQEQKNGQLAGVYLLQGVMETSAGFKLNPDHSFEYGFTYGAADKWGKGAWQLSGSKLILNSTHSEPKTDFILKESNANYKNGIRIKITGREGQPYAYIKARLGNEEGTTNAQGEVFFRSLQNGQLKLFHPVYSLRVSELLLTQGKTSFLIYPSADLSEVYLKGFTLTISGENIIADQLPGMPPEDAAGKLKRYVFTRQK